MQQCGSGEATMSLELSAPVKTVNVTMNGNVKNILACKLVRAVEDIQSI
jgi:hypothetical protein